MLTGELRQGANEGVVADAVAKASGQPIAAVRRAAMLLGDLGERRASGAHGPVARCRPDPAHGRAADAGRHRRRASPRRIADIGLASVEWKLDGIRVQAHKRGDEVRLFSRGLNDITAGLPGVVELVRTAAGRARSCSMARRSVSTRTGNRGSSRRR